ncbi:ATP-binding protein [Mycetohabitans sp. B8]|uniref:ATP-binding SpoIIE family protein phosphatase n=1 Tax=Mycetohabitans sp. B8 TaxID=2841845 RepID=UPI001F1EEAD8|nr:ATP-binding SpoIIE family protein phosphatase [Mycetohabitans sp. B8]MCG1042445.1 ATP-binding protein [Mycetohabitans sp. B8]
MENTLGAALPSGGAHCSLEIADASAVAFARRTSAEAARKAGFAEVDAGRLAIVTTEATTNILKHARHGEVLMRPLDGAVELIAMDRGPGMHDVRAALMDGHSTAGTAGTGLGAIRRLADQFALYSQPGVGTVVRVLLCEARKPPAHATLSGLQIGGVCVPCPGQQVCGDAWHAQFDPRGMTLALADGLGHGADAHVAAYGVVEVVQRGAGISPARLMEQADAALQCTRGAAIALVRVDWVNACVTFCGTGNISAVAHGTGHPQHHAGDRAGAPRERYPLISRNGIVGHTMRGTQEFEMAWNADAMLVLHSDGVGTRWDLSDYPGLSRQPAAIIAAVLYRDFSRRRDDATVVVVKARTQAQLSHDDAFATNPARV